MKNQFGKNVIDSISEYGVGDILRGFKSPVPMISRGIKGINDLVNKTNEWGYVAPKGQNKGKSNLMS